MQISELNTNPTKHNNRRVTVAGTVRATYNQPFPHFLLEDETGTIICRAQQTLPTPTSHLQISGTFLTKNADPSGLGIPHLTEQKRYYLTHRKAHCTPPSSQFPTAPPAQC